MSREKLRKKYADVVDKELAMMTEKEFKRYMKYLDELHKLTENEQQEVEEDE